MLLQVRISILMAMLAISALGQPATPSLDPPINFDGYPARLLEDAQKALAKRATEIPGSISITITDSVTGRPITGASISLGPPGVPVDGYLSSHVFTARAIGEGKVAPITATTNQMGVADFPKTLTGTYAVDNVVANGYSYTRPDPANPLFSPIVVVSGQRSTGSATVSPFAVIEGTVFDQDNHPIQGAVVNALKLAHNDNTGLATLASALDAKTSPSDANGRFRVYNLPPGHYYFVATTNNVGTANNGKFAPSYYPTGDIGQATLVKVPGPETTLDIRMHTASRFSIRGKISGAQDLTRASVLFSSCSQSGGTIIRPDAEGFFQYANVLPDLYCLSASVLDPSGPVSSSRAAATVVVADRDVEGVSLTVQKAFVLTGSFTGDGTPAFELAPMGNASPPVAPKFDTDKHTITIANINAGDYRFRDTSSSGVFVKSIKLGNQEIPDGILRVRGAGSSLQLGLAPVNGQLSIHLQDFSTTAPAAAIVLLPQGSFSGRRDLVRTTATGDNGSAELRNLPAIPYRVYALSQFDPGYSIVPEFLALLPGQSVNVTESTSVEASLISPRQIDEALARVTPASYPAPSDVIVAGANPVLVPTAKPTASSPDLGTISLVITDAQTGQPLSEARVALEPGAHTATSAANGEVKFSGLRPADYYVNSVTATGHAYWSEDLHAAPPATIRVPGPGLVDAGNFPVSRTGSIQGTIRSQNGQPVQGVIVSAFGYRVVDGIRTLRSMSSAGQPDDQGVFRIQNLPAPGLYYIVASSLPSLQNGIPDQLHRFYETMFYPGASSPVGAERVALAPGATVNGINFTIAEISPLTITVQTSPPLNASGLRIRACKPGSPDDYGYRVNSRVSKDSTEFLNVSPGTYCVTLRPDPLPTPGALRIARPGEGIVYDTASVTVSNSSVTGITINGTPPPKLSGTVTVPAGTSFPTNIDLVPFTEPIAATSIPVDPKTGAFQLEQLSRIPFHIVPRGMPDGLYMKSDALLDGSKLDGPLKLEFARATATLTGRVVNSNGPMTIVLAPENNRRDLVRTVSMKDDGTFEMSNVAPGIYNAYAWASADPRLPPLADFRALLQATPVTITTGRATIEVNPINREQLDEAIARY